MKNSSSAFSLIEIVMAVLLLTTVAAGLFTAFVTAHKWIRPELNRGYNIAREKLELLYGQVGATRSLEADENVVHLDNLSYQERVKISGQSPGLRGIDKDHDRDEDYKKVEVTVTLPS